jgi:hypothetical protein
MAQSGFTPIQLYRSATPGAVPLAADLAPGELALNTADEKLFFENASGVVVSIDKANGTVTSVNASGGFTGLTFSGGPITSSGTLTLSGTLVAVNGGTGQSSYAVGDILFASTTTALSKLADVATGNALISGGVGVAPSYGKIGLTTHVSGTLPVANGGTGTTTAFTSGSVVFAGASGVYSQDNANLFWDNTNDRLGIGTTAPAQTLQILNAGNYQLRMGGGGSINYDLGRNASNGLFYLYGNQTGFTGYVFDGVDGERMRITSAGNVGVGTSSPAGLLHVNSTSTTNAIVSGSDAARLVINGDTANSGDTGTEDASLIFETDGAYSSAVNSGLGNSGFRLGLLNGAAASTLVFVDILSGVDRERMRIDGSGNVGIGTTTPAQRLHVRQDQNGTTAALIQNRNGSGTPVSAMQFISGAFDLSDSRFAMISSAGGSNPTLQFWTGSGATPTERMRISDTGNVGIGTTSPGAKLTVADNSANDAFRITQTGTGNAFVVEDSASPDASPVVINNDGRLIVADTVSRTIGGITTSGIQVHSTNSDGFRAGLSAFAWDADATGSALAAGTIVLNRSASDTTGTATAVVANNCLGSFRWTGADGTAFRPAAGVYSFADGTVSANSVPGRIVFNTTAVGGTTDVERMRITSAGNVGIGTATPASVLDVNGDVTITDKIIHSGDTNTSIRFPAADTFTVETAGSERMRIDSSGNVGIGTTSPGARLEITDGSNTPLIVNSGGGADTTRGIAFNISGANFGRILVPAASGGAMAFWAGTSGAAAERMRITSAGNVGINETAPDYKLDVNGTFGFTPGASVTPVDNGDVVFELTNNTTLTVKAKGSDGVVRSGTIILV